MRKKFLLGILGVLTLIASVFVSIPANAHSESGYVTGGCRVYNTPDSVTSLLGPVNWSSSHYSSLIQSGNNNVEVANHTTGRLTIRVRTYVGSSNVYNSGWWTLDGRNSGSASNPGQWDAIDLPVVTGNYIAAWLGDNLNPRTLIDYYRTDDNTQTRTLALWWSHVDYGGDTYSCL